jgi:hypothetical protein
VRKKVRAARVMATATRVVGNEEGDVNIVGNGNSNEGPTVWLGTTTKQ